MDDTLCLKKFFASVGFTRLIPIFSKMTHCHLWVENIANSCFRKNWSSIILRSGYTLWIWLECSRSDSYCTCKSSIRKAFRLDYRTHRQSLKKQLDCGGGKRSVSIHFPVQKVQKTFGNTKPFSLNASWKCLLKQKLGRILL